MQWWDGSVDLDLAAAIAADMQQVAKADAQLHKRELALIAIFERGLPRSYPRDGSQQITDPRLQRSYLRALTRLALADGEFADEEYAVLRTLAAKRGIDNATVAAVTAAALRDFKGVARVDLPFTDSVDAVAHDLGGRDIAWN